MTDTPPRDPDCTCGWSPTIGRIWCQHCRTDGPQPGTLADPGFDHAKFRCYRCGDIVTGTDPDELGRAVAHHRATCPQPTGDQQ